jgi:hypothetical protein
VRSAERSAAPPEIRQTSVEVPPISNESASAKPALVAIRAAPTTPPAGPDSSDQEACAAASSRLETPPDERITSGRGSPARSHASPRASKYAASVGPRDASAVVVEARSYSLNSGATSCDATTWGPREPPPQLVADGALVSVVAERKEQADGDRVRVDLGERREVKRLDDAARAQPLPHAEGPLERDEGLGMSGAEPVEVGRVLAPQVERVLEAGGGDEGRSRSLALEQRVRRHGRAMGEPVDLRRLDRARRRQHRVLL